MPCDNRPSLVWKQLLGQPLDMGDLEAIDTDIADYITEVNQVRERV
jgi:hypothetical protein